MPLTENNELGSVNGGTCAELLQVNMPAIDSTSNTGGEKTAAKKGRKTYQSYLKRTVILQKKAIRYIHKADYNAHTKPLFYASNVLNIHYTYLLEVAKFMHDFTRRKLPTPLLNFFSSNLTVHKHNTRQVLDPHFSIIYNSIAEKSIIHRGPRIWSNIPQPIKECETKNSFNKLLKRHFLTNQEHLS